MLASGWPSGTAEAFGVRGTQVQAGEEVQRLADFLNEGQKIAILAGTGAAQVDDRDHAVRRQDRAAQVVTTRVAPPTSSSGPAPLAAAVLAGPAGVTRGHARTGQR